jgi:ribose transport system substrate-binding protein
MDSLRRRTKVSHIGFHVKPVNPDALVTLKEDPCRSSTLVRDPFRIGYEGVKTALAAAKGEQVPPTVDIGTSVITKANMNSARSQQLLNPKID